MNGDHLSPIDALSFIAKSRPLWPSVVATAARLYDDGRTYALLGDATFSLLYANGMDTDAPQWAAIIDAAADTDTEA